VDVSLAEGVVSSLNALFANGGSQPMDWVRARELGPLTPPDDNHLARATRLGYVLVTHDVDFIQLVANGMQHAGIILSHPIRHTDNDWVRAIKRLWGRVYMDQMKDHVEYLDISGHGVHPAKEYDVTQHWIERHPLLRAGQPVIGKTSTRVIDVIMAMRYHALSPEQAANNFQLNLSEIYAAMAFYEEHNIHLDKDIDEQLKRADELKEKRIGSAPPLLFG
jgi:uncharacterized protein (DUF433 family)